METLCVDLSSRLLKFSCPQISEMNISDYSENFEITYDSGKWIVNIKNGLDDDILNDNSELVITITASQIGKENVGKAILLLKLPSKITAPKFSKAYYTADYPKNGSGDIEFEPSLEFADIDNPKDILIALDRK